MIIKRQVNYRTNRSAVRFASYNPVKRVFQRDMIELTLRATLVLVIASLFFEGIFPILSSVRTQLLCLALVAAALHCLQNEGRVLISFSSVLWLVFLGYCVFNQGSALVDGSDAIWLRSVALIVALSFLLAFEWEKWISVVMKASACFGIVCAAATIIFFLMPQVYEVWFKPTFYSESVNAVGYMSGLASHYSLNGMYLVWGLLATWTLLLASNNEKKARYFVASVVVFIALLLTTKRAHLLFGICCCVALYLLLHSGDLSKRLLYVIFGLFILIVLFFLASMLVPELARVVTRFEGLVGDDSFGGRSSYYEICLGLYHDRPLSGFGWNAFTETLYSSGILDLRRLYAAGNLNQNAHNVFLQLLAEEGIVGLTLFLSASFAVLVKSILVLRKLIKKTPECESEMPVLFSIGIQCFFLLYCFTGNPLYEPVEYFVFFLSTLPIAFHSFKYEKQVNASPAYKAFSRRG